LLRYTVERMQIPCWLEFIRAGIFREKSLMEPSTLPKKKKGQRHAARELERPELLARPDAIEDIIRQYAEDTIRGAEHQIMSKASEGLTEINYPLPMDFSRDGGIEANSMRAVVWGKTIEHFEDRPEAFEMAVVRSGNDESFLLRLRWKKSIDAELVAHYTAKVTQYMQNS
jgi:hypothetical protein